MGSNPSVGINISSAGVAKQSKAGAAERVARSMLLRVRLSPPASETKAGVVQQADTPVLKIGFCGFDSHLPHHKEFGACNPTGRGGRFKTCLSESSTLSTRTNIFSTSLAGR